MNHFQQQLWQNILANQGKPIRLKGGKYVTFETRGMRVVWKAMEPTQRNLYPQTLQQIMACVPARIGECGPSSYPGTAKSYKFALLNSVIWTKDLADLVPTE